MDSIFRKLERPVPTDIRLAGLAGSLEPFPSRIPDLYEGEPVVVTLKAGTLPEQVTVRGSTGTSLWVTSVTLTNGESREGVSTCWARRKIASLLDQLRHGEDEAIVRQAALDPALAHHPVSKYTSLVAVAVTPGRPGDKTLLTHALKTNLPAEQDCHLRPAANCGERLVADHAGASRARGRGAVVADQTAARMRVSRAWATATAAFIAVLPVAGAWHVCSGAWIYAKARLAQVLLQRARAGTLQGRQVKPWPWADTWPVARLRVPRLGVDQIELEDVTGRTLAFGPGHAASSPLPGRRASRFSPAIATRIFAFFDGWPRQTRS